MLLVNLKVLLAERGLTISKVAADTSISRTTLTSLCNNTGQGIYFDILNKLCTYLKISPADFFLYVPYDYWFSVNHQSKQLYSLDFYLTSGKSTCRCFLLCHIDQHDDGTSVFVRLDEEDENEKITNLAFKRFFNSLPPLALQNLEYKIADELPVYGNSFGIFWEI